MRQNGAPEAVWESTGLWTTRARPRLDGRLPTRDSRLLAGSGNPMFDEYRKRLAARAGETEAARALAVTR
jgi:hypothetical protein